MKNFFIIMCLSVFSVTAFSRVTEEDKKVACAKVLSIIPSDSGEVTLEKCIRNFDFTEISEAGSTLRKIEMIGQTVEDNVTVCEVVIVSNPNLEVKADGPTCELE